MTNLLGDEGIVASRVGQMTLAMKRNATSNASALALPDTTRSARIAQELCRSKSMRTDSRTFQIAEPAAWDSFEWTPTWQSLAQKADAVCFGSLAQRCSAVPRNHPLIFENNPAGNHTYLRCQSSPDLTIPRRFWPIPRNKRISSN